MNQVLISRRKIDTSVKYNTHIPTILQNLYISRGIRKSRDIHLKLKNIINWSLLPGIEHAVKILHDSFVKKLHILVVGDFDVDGASSTALAILAIKEMGYTKINYIMLHRCSSERGLDQELVQYSYKKYQTKLIIIVDSGTSSYKSIDYARKIGIHVIVLDHHLPGKKIPNAIIVNPNISQNSNPLKSLSGVGVVFYFLIGLRSYLKRKNWFVERNIAFPDLKKFLDLVALGTISDLAPLDVNNRILVWKGINLIRSARCRPGIQALIDFSKKNFKTITTNDISFILSPKINAAGRLKNMTLGVELLICPCPIQAKKLATQLDIINKERKRINMSMQKQALILCKEEYKKEQITSSIVIFHATWHQGLTGILASKIQDMFAVPTIVFAPTNMKKAGILKGSGRSIAGFNMQEAFEKIDSVFSDLLLCFGGHAIAAGLTIKLSRLQEFKKVFNDLVEKQIMPQKRYVNDTREIISDGCLSCKDISLQTAEMIYNAGPWGNKFPEPSFDGIFYLVEQVIIANFHLKIKLRCLESSFSCNVLEGIMFNVDKKTWPDVTVRKIRAVYKLNINEFYLDRRMQLIVTYMYREE